MNRIENLFKKIRKDRRLSSCTVALLGVGLLVVAALFVLMPDLQAATFRNVTWAESAPREYQLSALENGDGTTVTKATINVSDGLAYTIDGSGTDKTNINVVFNYSGYSGTVTNPAVIYITLDNVKVNQTLDATAFRFTSSGNPVNYIITVKGNCEITSTCQGAYSPLIAVEDGSYTLYRLKKPAGASANLTIENYVTAEDVSKQVGLILKGDTPTATLSLKNARESLGALIGSGEATQFLTDSTRDINDLIARYNNLVRAEGQITVSNPQVALNLTQSPYNFTTFNGIDGVFEPQYKYKSSNGIAAGSVTIGGMNGEAPLVVKLANNGYGAAIGGGGNEIAAGKATDSGKITINAGTVTFIPSEQNTNAPIFGSGIAKGATRIEDSYGETGGIEINGGSIFLGAYANKFGNDVPKNKDGDRVYEVQVNTRDEEVGKSILDIEEYADGDSLNIQYINDPNLEFGTDISNATTNYVRNNGIQNILDVDVTLSSSLNYGYDGVGHDNRYMLYFWLPAIETTTLTITDEVPLGRTEFVIKNQRGEVMHPQSSDVNSPNNRKYTLVRDEIYYLTANRLPNGVSIRNVALTINGETSTAYYYANSGFYIKATAPDISAYVTYGGSIEVVFLDGLLAEDRDNHSVILPNYRYEYGTESYEIPVLSTTYRELEDGSQITDLLFKAWTYTDSEGNPLGYITHITKDVNLDGNKKVFSDIIQPDGKIYLKPEWNVKVSYELGQGTLPPNTNFEQDIYIPYGSGIGNVVELNIPRVEPELEQYSFIGWKLDDEEESLYTYNTTLGAVNKMNISSLSGHVFNAAYEKTGFNIYIDATKINEEFSELSCVGSNGLDILRRDTDGKLLDVVIEGKKYYYTKSLRKDATARVVIRTKSGYKIQNCSMRITGSASNSVVTDGAAGECRADITVGTSEVYVSTDATFAPVKYEITFRDGKTPNDLLWSGNRFEYDIDDIENGRTLGDIIRSGLSMSYAAMPDDAIAAYVNTIDKNTRFTDFSGWKLPFTTNVLSTNTTLRDIFASNANLNVGDLVFNANWTEYNKYIVDIKVDERVFRSNGTYVDNPTDKFVAVLYYYTDGNIKSPIYTEERVNADTGEVVTQAFAKAGDKIEAVVFRANANGRPMGEPISTGIKLEQLYYTYNNDRNELVQINVTSGNQVFTVKDDVKAGEIIHARMAVSLERFSISYWDTRGYDNSANPTTYSVFDEIDFMPIADGIPWKLVCADKDESNKDDVSVETISGIRQGGRLVTDGPAGSRGYMSNLILKPDWSDFIFTNESYYIDIDVEDTDGGDVNILYPTGARANGYYANDTIIISAVAKPGYKLVEGSVVYKKDTPTTFLTLRTRDVVLADLTSYFAIPVVDEQNGIYLFKMPASDIIVTAEFEVCEYNINYTDIPADTINPNPESYNFTSDIVLGDAIREGYEFLGWYDEFGNKIVRIVNRMGDINLTPEFRFIEPSPEEPSTEEPSSAVEEPSTEEPSGEEPSTEEPSSAVEEPSTEEPSREEPSSAIEEPSTEGESVNGDVNRVTENVAPIEDEITRPNGMNNNVGNPSTIVIEQQATNNGAAVQNRPQNLVGRPYEPQNNAGTTGNLQTGDHSNVPRLILICVASVLVLLIAFVKRPESEEEV